MPVNYRNGIIYRIYDNTNGDVYYGSTANTLRFRMGGHKTDAKSDKSICKSKSIILNDDYVYNEVEKYPCNSKKELHTRERYYIENFTCVNKNVPTRTIPEYYKKYYEDNKERINEKNKKYQQDHKDKLKEYNKKYYQDNKDDKKEYTRKYQQDNKERINEKHNCNCGGKYSTISKSQHERTKRHQKYITENKLF